MGLRRRLEQIVNEMREMRDSLARVSQGLAGGSGEDVDPETTPTPGETGISSDALSAANVRRLRVQRARQHSRRAAQEVLGVALSFEDIGRELENNRVDAQDRRERLTGQIVQPLTDISKQMFPDLDQQLTQLAALLSQSPPDQITQANQVAVAQSDAIIWALEGVLDRMLELETYNELMDLLRTMIKEQEQLLEKTKEQRKKSALDLLK